MKKVNNTTETETKKDTVTEEVTETITQPLDNGKKVMLWDREEALLEGTVKTRELRDNVKALKTWDAIDFSSFVGTTLWSRKTLGTTKDDNLTKVFYRIAVDAEGIVDMLHLVTQQINIVMSRADGKRIDKLTDGMVIDLKLSDVSKRYVGRGDGVRAKPIGSLIAQAIKLFRNPKLGLPSAMILTQLKLYIGMKTTSESDMKLLMDYQAELVSMRKAKKVKV